MKTAIEKRQYWDTPTKSIVSVFLLSFAILTAISTIPLTIKQVKTHQEARVKADSIYSDPIITPISSNQVVILFTTKIPVVSRLNLISPSEKQVLLISKDPQTTHSITLKFLNKETNYTFNLFLEPATGNSITTDDYTFSTPK